LRAERDEKDERSRGEQQKKQDRWPGNVFWTKDKNDQGASREVPVVRRCADRLREG